jgi:hypothetical protein
MSDNSENNTGRTELTTRGEAKLSEWRDSYKSRKTPFIDWKNFASKSALVAFGLVIGVLITSNSTGELEASPVDTAAEAATIQAEIAEQAALEDSGNSDVEVAQLNFNVLQETVNLWQRDGHAWVQFDYEGQENIWLHWQDSEGRSSLNSLECTGTMSNGNRRCYTGRSYPRINIALGRGYTPGMWSVLACDDELGTNCMEVGMWEIPSVLGSTEG